jgi:hypothetical protein
MRPARSGFVCLCVSEGRFVSSGPQHQPTAELRGIVERLVTVMGATHVQVAKVLGLSKTTVYAHYKRELEKAALEVDIAVASTFLTKALGGPVEEGDANWRQADSALLSFYLARRVPGLAEAHGGRPEFTKKGE